MTDWLTSLWSTDGFVPRKECGAWTPGWVALHTLSDVLIWLAYLSIPLVLLAVARHPAVRPLRPMLWLFAAFIVSCGTVHLIEAVIFDHPIYRLSGVVKGVTAVVSWVTVFALVPTLRKVLPVLDTLPAAAPPLPPADVPSDAEHHPALVYSLAVLVGLLAVLVRFVLDPVLADIPAFGMCILAVVFMAWYGGFGPGLVTLLLTAILNVYLFIPPRYSPWVEGLGQQINLGLYLVTGLGVLVLGELQRRTGRRLQGKMAQLRAATSALAGEKESADRALAQLDALVRNAPYTIAFYDDQLRFLRVNEALAENTGLPVAAHFGKHLLDVRPDAPPEAVAAFREVLAGAPPVIGKLVSTRGRVFEMTAFQVPVEQDRMGLGVIAKDVTERQTAAERIRESEEKFRAMADGIPQLAWMTRPDGHIFWYNRRWFDYTGTTLEQMEGWGWQAVHDPAELPRVVAKFRRHIESGLPWEDTFPLRRHDGEYRWHLSRAIPLKDEGGNVLLWFGTNTDVTDQRRMEEQLRESEGRFRNLAEAMPQIVWMTRPDGYHEYFNSRWYEFTGLTAEQSLGWGWSGPLHPDDVERAKARWQQSTDTGQPYEIEYRFRRHDGEYEWFLGRAVPVRDSGGQVVRWLGTCTGIHEQVMTAQALQASETRFRQLADAMPQIVYVNAADGRPEYINRQWVEYTGRTDTAPETVAAVMHPDDLPALGERWAKAQADGRPMDAEFRLRRAADGEYRWFLTRAVPVLTPDGRVEKWYGTSTDIHEQKRQAEALADKEAYLRGILDNSPDCIKVIDLDGRVVEFNKPGLVALQIDDCGPYLHCPWADLWPADSRERVRQAVENAVAGRVDRFSGWSPTAKGVAKFWDVLVAPIPDASGRVVRVVGVSRDVTELKRGEDDLREAKRFNEEVLNSLPAHVTVIDADGKIVSVNRSWRQFGTEYGLRPGHEWVGTSYFSPVVADGPSRPNAELTAGILSVLSGEREQFDAEYLSTGTDGERYFHMRANRFHGDGPVRLVITHEDVSERVRAEKQLQEATRFNESVLHSLPGHLAVIAEDGHILAVNESWRQFAQANGVPAGHDWTADNYFHACRLNEHGERAAAGIRAVARGERGAFEMEYPCHGGGVERYFLLRANRFRGDGPVRLVVTHENITERVVAERQVREGASQLAQLTEGVPLLMWACTPTGECDYLSRQWLDYTGRGLVEQLGYAWLDAVHPEDREHTAGAWRKAVAAGGGYDVEFRLLRHDGAYRWFAVRGIPLRDQTGTVVRWFGSCTDVDDRVQQEELLGRLVEERTLALQEQKIFLNAILDNVAEGVVACDADGKLQLFNAATRRIHGLPAEPLPPERWVEHYHLFEADGVTPMPTERVPLRRAWRGEEVREAEMVVRADGQPDRFLVCFGQQLRGQDGQVFGAVVSMRDMTERREYERELVRTADALRTSNEELEKFAYIASHDLQEPLRKIQAFGTRLADKFRDAVGEQGKDYIDRMLDSAGRMRRLIQDLLAFSRVTTKGVAFVPVDLNTVARDVLNDLDDQLTRSGGRVEVGPLPTLPGDLSQLRQVFQNLIGNALKFATPNVPPVVTVTATPFDRLPEADRPAGAGWRVVVADNGIGFDPQYADRIFELFQRLHGRGEYEGTGLGLAIVRKIILRHGAAVTAHSRLGQGAEFRIDWPTPGPS
jgi:PAS domain S-box-containing protein